MFATTTTTTTTTRRRRRRRRTTLKTAVATLVVHQFETPKKNKVIISSCLNQKNGYVFLCFPTGMPTLECFVPTPEHPPVDQISNGPILDLRTEFFRDLHPEVKGAVILWVEEIRLSS